MSRYAEKAKVSSVRRLMLNNFSKLTGDPSVGGGCSIDATNLLGFIERVNKRSNVKITITHVLVKMVADALREYPELNVKVVGRRIYRLKHVDVRVAINLFPTEEDSPEVLLAMIRDADRKQLGEIAEECVTVADWSRRTGLRKTISGKLLRLTKYLPDPIFNTFTRLGLRIATSGRLPVYGLARDPMGSVALTNVGPFGLPKGVGGVQATGLLPPFGYASLVVALPIEERAIVVDGELKIKPVIPIGAAVDHRAIDGYKVFRYMNFWSNVIQNPDEYFEGKV